MRRERGWVGEGGLLASCRLNKSRVKEMEREKQALFRHKLLLFEGWNRKGKNKWGMRIMLREQKRVGDRREVIFMTKVVIQGHRVHHPHLYMVFGLCTEYSGILLPEEQLRCNPSVSWKQPLSWDLG